MQKYSDEAIVAAILQAGTICEAAKTLGVSPRMVYDRMQNQNFCSLYTQAKADILREAVSNINRRISKAVDVIAEVMDDADNNAAIRLQAANAILTHAGKLNERLAVLMRDVDRMESEARWGVPV